MEKDKIIMVAAMAPWIHANKSEGFGNDSIEVTRDEILLKKFERELSQYLQLEG